VSIAKMLNKISMSAFNGRPLSKVAGPAELAVAWRRQHGRGGPFVGPSSERETWHDRRDQRAHRCS
jgi:hypothetical protein